MMRVLFTGPPDIGHAFPLISLAWAMRTSGHKVLLATSEKGTDVVTRAGLPTIDVSPDFDFNTIFTRFVPFASVEGKSLGRQWAETGVTPDPVIKMFVALSDVMADGVTHVAERWRPDLVVHARLEGAGPLAARKLGVPAVEHGYGFLCDDNDSERLLSHLSASYRRNNVPSGPPHHARIHVSPPSMTVGGAGTMLTAACAAVPQLVLPHDADHFVNATVAAERGVGLVRDPAEVDVDVLDTLLHTDRMRGAAAEVRSEIERMPPPFQIVPELLELAGFNWSTA